MAVIGSISHEALRAVPPFIAGVAAGYMTELAALYPVAHEQLAHAYGTSQPGYERVARYTLAAAGLSSNRFALEHRLHHRDTVPPRGVVASARYALGLGTSRREPRQLGSEILFDTTPINADPLLTTGGDGELKYRHDPAIERVASIGLPGALLPAAALSVAGSRLPGSSLRRSIAFMVGFEAGLAGKGFVTAYGEARLGLNRGQVGSSAGMTVLERFFLDRHRRHHNTPGDHEAGVSKAHALTMAGLQKLGLFRYK